MHLNWCDVLEPGFGVFFQKKQLMETSPKVAVVIPKHYGVISQHYGVTSWNHDRIHFPLFLLLMDLQSPWRKGLLYSFVLFRVLGPPLCQSSVCMVSHNSTALTTIDLWQRHFWMSCVKISGYVKRKTPFGNPALFFWYATPIQVYIYIYSIYICVCVYVYLYYNMEMI